MKNKTVKSIGIIVFSLMLITLGGCRSGEKTTRNDFGRQITMPCETSSHKTDSEFIRTSHVARSSDLTLSKDKAFLVTQERLASLIESSMRSAARRYANERTVAMDYNLAEQFEIMILSSVSNTNHMMHIICEETFVNEAGVYTTAMALEIGKGEILEAVMNRQNRERYFQLENDMEKFRRIFEEETRNPVLR